VKTTRVLLALTLLALSLLPLIGCATKEEPKPDKGTSYYTGPINKGGSKAETIKKGGD
jgi:hypothetical protein